VIRDARGIIVVDFCQEKKQAILKIISIPSKAYSKNLTSINHFGVRRFFFNIPVLDQATLTTKEALLLGEQSLPHPPCSPDLAPSDYHLFYINRH